MYYLLRKKSVFYQYKKKKMVDDLVKRIMFILIHVNVHVYRYIVGH